MNNILKAKLIVELLDDRKYPILSSLSNIEMNQLNTVSVDMLTDISTTDISSTIKEFTEAVDTKKAIKKEAEEKAAQEAAEAAAEAKRLAEEEAKKGPTEDELKAEAEALEREREAEERRKLDEVITKLQSQPLQIIACAIDRFNDDQKEYILSNMPEPQKQAIVSTDVANLPVSSQVVDLIVKELEINV